MKVNTDAIVTHKKDALVQSEREEGKGSASKLTEHVQLMYESNCAHPKLADDRVSHDVGFSNGKAGGRTCFVPLR